MLESPMPYKYENTPVAYSTGNYGVRYYYSITIKNNGAAKKVYYQVATNSNIIGFDFSEDDITKRIKIKGEKHEETEVFDNLFEFDVPANQTVNYNVVVLLPTGDAGRIANRIIVQ